LKSVNRMRFLSAVPDDDTWFGLAKTATRA
jgi:hypothetical protein